ncbi:MAG: hypothetical protein ACLVKK_02205 [Ruthenibacterium sp.]
MKLTAFPISSPALAPSLLRGMGASIFRFYHFVFLKQAFFSA